MAKPSVATAGKKKKKRPAEEDEPVKKKKKVAAPVEDEDDEDEDEDSDDDETTDDDDDGAEDEDEDADDSEEDDDAEEEEEDDDDSDSDDDDEDEAPAKKKKSASSNGDISWDTDDAEAGGLPEGRVVLKNPHTRMGSTADYTKDDPDGVPLLSITCVPVKGDDLEPFDIHLSAGKAARIVATDDGSGFAPAEGSSAKGLSKSSNTFYFLKSLEDAGFPKAKLRAKGIAAIDGTDVDLVRVPQPVRKGLAAADDEDSGGKTMPSIATIHSYPWESKGQKSRDKADAVLAKSKKKGGKKRPKAEGPVEDDDDAAEAPAPKKVKKATGNGKKLSDSDVIDAADRAVLQAIEQEKFVKAGLPMRDAYPEAFKFVKTDPNRKAIMGLIESNSYLQAEERPWEFDQRHNRLMRV